MSSCSGPYLAHSDRSGRTDPLSSHLQLVAKRASEYAMACGLANEAYLSGLLHDLGKYGDLFQLRLKGKESGIDHWSAGACAALKHQAKGVAPALAIQGHHIGLQAGDPDSIRGIDLGKLGSAHPLKLRLSEPDMSQLVARFQADALKLPNPADIGYAWTGKWPVATMLDVRMLFSALVDADFVETEAYFDGTDNGSAYRKCGQALAARPALERLTRYLVDIAKTSPASASVNGLRDDVLRACLAAASRPCGLFNLSAPTGTGKTLAMLAFALKHAVDHRLRRVVIVIPYLNIIEQTVGQFRGVFESWCGKDISSFILEDHSLAGIHANGDKIEDIASGSRLLAEDWDAPIVVTTSVQFLESLFANRPAPCRKLHNLAGSVILFDEVQTLPAELAIPTLAALSHLVRRYGSTVVFATATQPAFGNLDEPVKKLGGSGWAPTEITPSDLALFSRAKRNEVLWPDLDKPTPWKDLAAQMQNSAQSLLIVNLKRHATNLCAELKQFDEDNLFHLSTNMCPLHRQVVLAEVRQRLKEGLPCWLVSTQCVEAGVDIDFPVVYRALGPLDAIAQAAGRCNRHGVLASLGKVCVFIPEDEGYPDAAYRQATGVTRALLRELGAEGMDINNPDLYDRYYCRLYLIKDLEKAKKELRNAIERQDFVQVAEQYRLIQQDTINVLVPYRKAVFEELKDDVSRNGLTRQWIARARPYTISLYRPRDTDPVKPYLDPVPMSPRFHKEESSDWYIFLKEEYYDMKLGLVLPPSSGCLIA